MKPIEVSVEVDAPAERVFAVATDFEGAASRVRAIEEVEMLSEPPHVPVREGVAFRETRVMMGKRATETMRVTAVELPADGLGGSCELHAASHGMEYTSWIRVRPLGEGERCELTMGMTGRALSFGAKLMAPLLGLMMRGSVRKAFEADLEDLKGAAEVMPG